MGPCLRCLCWLWVRAAADYDVRRPRAFGGGRILPLTSIDRNGIAPPWSRLMKDIWKFQRDSSKKSAAASQFRRLAFQFQTAAFGKLRKRPERPEWGALLIGKFRQHQIGFPWFQ